MAYDPNMDVTGAQHELTKAALTALMAREYGRESDPHADADSEYADEQLALAARQLVRAVEALPENERPIGWGEPDAAKLQAEVEALRAATPLRTCRKCGRERSVGYLVELDSAEWMCAYGNCPEPTAAVSR